MTLELIHNQSLEVWDSEFELSHHCMMVSFLIFLLKSLVLLTLLIFKVIL